MTLGFRIWAVLAFSLATLAAPLSAELVPQRQAVGTAMVSKADPGMRVQLPKSARHIGATRFILYGVADCEIHIFVEADAKKRVRRFYWIQFERYLPEEPDLSYDYSSEQHRAMSLWGKGWRVRPRFGLSSEKPQENSDWEQARTIIEKAGYKLPKALMNVSLIHLLDDPQNSGTGRTEVAIFYNEDMALSGHRAEDFIKGPAINEAAWAPVAEALVKRALARISVSE